MMNRTCATSATWAGMIGCVLFSVLLILTGQGDTAESYRTWIIASSILLAAGIFAEATSCDIH
jgi:hypothetical protein